MDLVSKYRSFLNYLNNTVVFPSASLSNLSNTLQTIFLVILQSDHLISLLLTHSCYQNCILCILKQIHSLFKSNKSIPKSLTSHLQITQTSDFLKTFDSTLSLLFQSNSSKLPISSYFVDLFYESQCNCGLIEGTSLSKSLSIRVPVDRLMLPESQFKDSFCIIERDRAFMKRVSRLGKKSVFFRSNQKICENLKSILHKPEKNRNLCENDECSGFSEKIVLNDQKGKELFFGFEYKQEDKILFNSIQILTQLENPLELNKIVEGSEKVMFIKFIVFTDFKINSLCFLKDFRWFQANESSFSLIGNGKWADLALFALKSSFFPLIVSYSSEVASECLSKKNLTFSKYQLIILEMLSYSIEFIGNNQGLIASLFYNIGSFHCDRLEIPTDCIFCKKKKKIYEICQCGFVENDWICSNCNYYNFCYCKICSNCQMIRIWLESEFFCDKCGMCSFGSLSCLYCPFTRCSSCFERLSAFISVFCTSCGKYTLGNSKCNQHSLKCKNCLNY